MLQRMFLKWKPSGQKGDLGVGCYSRLAFKRLREAQIGVPLVRRRV